MFGMVLAAIAAMGVSVYAYTYVSTATKLDDRIVTLVFYLATYTGLRLLLSGLLGI